MAPLGTDLNTKNLEQKLRMQTTLARAEKANVDALFASIGEGIIVTDEKGIIIRINQQTLDILGYKEDEILGKWFPDVVVAVNEDGSLVESTKRPIFRAFISGKTVSEKGYYKNKKGKIIPVAVSVSPVLLRNKPIGAIQIFRDITEENRTEHLMTDFIGIASHQLRTPLTAISTYIRMLRDGYAGDISESQKSFVDVVIDAAQRMNSLITTLLNITRIEAGNIKVNSRPFQIANVVSETVKEFALIAEQKGITLKTRLPRQSLQIKSDRLLIKEVFNNLLSNAIKYTPKDGTVNISLYSHNDSIIFKITDTGYGIPQKEQKYIFTKFFRSSNVTIKDMSGTGLGLYLTKNLVENVDGDIWFKSRRNHGTSFYVSLPKVGSEKKSGKFRLES